LLTRGIVYILLQQHSLLRYVKYLSFSAGWPHSPGEPQGHAHQKSPITFFLRSPSIHLLPPMRASGRVSRSASSGRRSGKRRCEEISGAAAETQNLQPHLQPDECRDYCLSHKSASQSESLSPFGCRCCPTPRCCCCCRSGSTRGKRQGLRKQLPPPPAI
jgi:hypothetical protein